MDRQNVRLRLGKTCNVGGQSNLTFPVGLAMHTGGSECPPTRIEMSNFRAKRS